MPETKRLDELLEEFQHTRNHMAMVLDEFGGVSGLVTIEDVLEEIVGEIVNEYDEALVEEIKSVDDRTAEVAAHVRIDEINKRLGTHLPEEGEFDAIGGFVFSHLGHIPTVGESVTVDDVRLTAIDATRRRIEQVRIEVLDPTRTVKRHRPHGCGKNAGAGASGGRVQRVKLGSHALHAQVRQDTRTGQGGPAA